VVVARLRSDQAARNTQSTMRSPSQPSIRLDRFILNRVAWRFPARMAVLARTPRQKPNPPAPSRHQGNIKITPSKKLVSRRQSRARSTMGPRPGFRILYQEKPMVRSSTTTISDAADHHLSTSHVQSSTVTPRAHRVSTPKAAEALASFGATWDATYDKSVSTDEAWEHRDCRRLAGTPAFHAPFLHELRGLFSSHAPGDDASPSFRAGSFAVCKMDTCVVHITLSCSSLCCVMHHMHFRRPELGV
jgi:hypothetical protein